MELPENWFLYKGIVIEKLKVYCDSNIWPFQYDTLASWLSNFSDEKEEYLALQLLDNLIVRSKDMARVGYARLLHSELRELLINRDIIKNSPIRKWKQQLKNGHLSNTIRFSPVRISSDEGESGGLVYRLLSSEIDTNRYSLAKCSSLPKVIVLIDDFIGSGDQFVSDFASEFSLDDKLKESTVIYCPLIAFEDGVNVIKMRFPELHVLPVEMIYKVDGFFSGDDKNLFKNDQVNTIGDVKKFYSDMKTKYAPQMDNWFGYKDACLPLVFEWGCPNQTPAICWMNFSTNKNGWKQLFSRRA